MFDYERKINMKKKLTSITKTMLAFAIVFLVLIQAATVDTLALTKNSANADTIALPTMQGRLNCKSAVLMEAETGRILYEQNAREPLPPASVTKIMTLLLVMEAIERGAITLDTMLTTSANAASMGGSQIFLEVGERMSVDDLIKSVVISSANDAAVVLAEAVSGSEEAFVGRMNERARELGMDEAVFENTNGLDDTAKSHVLSARDIAIMSRELIKYEKILEYSSTWMDSIRDGQFGLTNTNRLVRFYSGATGLKTGSTSKAKFCISASAKRDGMHLIAVIMGAESRDTRNAEAAKLLDWGFANFSLYSYYPKENGEVRLLGSDKTETAFESGEFVCLVPKGSSRRVVVDVELPQEVEAPLKKGDKIGVVSFVLDGKNIGTADIYVTEDSERITFKQIFLEILRKCCIL